LPFMMGRLALNFPFYDRYRRLNRADILQLAVKQLALFHCE